MKPRSGAFQRFRRNWPIGGAMVGRLGFGRNAPHKQAASRRPVGGRQKVPSPMGWSASMPVTCHCLDKAGPRLAPGSSSTVARWLSGWVLPPSTRGLSSTGCAGVPRRPCRGLRGRLDYSRARRARSSHLCATCSNISIGPSRSCRARRHHDTLTGPHAPEEPDQFRDKDDQRERHRKRYSRHPGERARRFAET